MSNFVVVSPGRSGSKWLVSVLDTVANITAMHEPGTQLPKDVHEILRRGECGKKIADLSAYPEYGAKLVDLSKEGGIYGESQSNLWPFVRDLTERLAVKAVHLVRNPVDCCSSMLSVETAGSPPKRALRLHPSRPTTRSTDPVCAMAEVWLRVHQSLLDQGCEQIRVAALKHLERAAGMTRLGRWLGADHYVDADTMRNLYYRSEIRNSHIDRKLAPPADERERETILELTENLYQRLLAESLWLVS